MKKIISFMLISQMLIISNYEAKACPLPPPCTGGIIPIPGDTGGDIITDPITNLGSTIINAISNSDGFPTIGIVGIALGGLGLLALGSLYAADKFNDIHKLQPGSKIEFFGLNSYLDDSDVQGYLVKSYNTLPLLSNALLISSSKKDFRNKSLESNEKPVSLIVNNGNKADLPKNEKTLLVRDISINNDTLHLYAFKLPENLTKAHKLSINITFISAKPDNSAEQGNINSNLAIYLYSTDKAPVMTENMSYNKSNHSDKFVEKLSSEQIHPDLHAASKKIMFIQKEYKINRGELNSLQQIIFAVASHDKSRNISNKHKYAAVLTIKGLN